MLDLIENLPVAIYEITVHPDGNTHVDFISESCWRILGISREVMIADREVFKRVMHPEDLPEFTNKLQAAHGNGTEFNAQVRIVVDGAIRWIELTSIHQ